MVFHESRPLADDSPENSIPVFFSKIRKDVAKCVVCCSCDWVLKDDKPQPDWSSTYSVGDNCHGLLRMAVLTVNNQLHNSLKEGCKIKTSICDMWKYHNHRSQTNH